MNDNRGWLAVGKRIDGAFVWYDDIRRQDALQIDDVVHIAGSVKWVKRSPYDRDGRQLVDVTDEYTQVVVDKFDEAWAEWTEVDETQQDFLAGTR